MAALRLTLPLVSLVLLSGAALPVSSADEPLAAPLHDGLLTVTGTVLMPDGAPAVGATVLSSTAVEERPIIVLTDEAGRFELHGMFGNGGRLHATSADGSHQTTLRVSAVATRRVFASAVELKLAPAAVHEVVVTADGEPVDGAHVVALGQGFRAPGLTGPDGTVSLQIPAGVKPNQLVGWHPKLGVDGARTFDDRPGVDLGRLSLHAPTSHTIHVVDTEGKPVRDVELGVSVRTENSDWIVADNVEAARARTDADGTAILSWIPREGLKYVQVDIMNSDWENATDLQRTSDGHTTVHVRREGRARTVEGRLIMPAGASAEGILISGSGFGPGSRGDAPYVRARRDGTFTLRVFADYGYVLGIMDPQWASNLWSGIILRNGSEKSADVAIEVYPATQVTVRVTRGADRVPVADAWVEASTLGTVEYPGAHGENEMAHIGPRSWLWTDSNGRVNVGVGIGIGETKIRLASGKWGEERTIDVSSKEPIEVEFHRPWLGDRKVSGRLVLNGKPYQSSPTLAAHAWAQRSPGIPLRFEPEIDAEGTFRVEFDADNLSLLFVDRQNEHCGFASLGAEESSVEIPMRPTATYSGTLVDENSKPMADRTVRLHVAKAYFDALAPQQTDQDGKFQFSGVASNVPLWVRLDNDATGPQYSVFSYERLFLPGEVRTGDVVKPSRTDSDRAVVRSSLPLAERVARNCRSARLSRMHGLVALLGDDSPNVANVANTILSSRETECVLHYVAVRLAPDQIKEAAKTLANFDWPLPAAGEVVLVVLDGDQRTIAAERIETDNSVAALKSAAAFLDQHKPASSDALALVAKAREAAQASGRRVWFVHGGPRCGPCFRLARWMDDHHAILEKDFVIVKVMGGLDEHVDKVLDELPRKEFGIPWHAITEPDGTVLVTSEGPLGNIGMPGSVEGIRHLRRMLEQTVQTLTSDEIDALAASLMPKR